MIPTVRTDQRGWNERERMRASVASHMAVNTFCAMSRTFFWSVPQHRYGRNRKGEASSEQICFDKP